VALPGLVARLNRTRKISLFLGLHLKFQLGHLNWFNLTLNTRISYALRHSHCSSEHSKLIESSVNTNTKHNGNIVVHQIGSSSNPLELRSDYFPCWLHQPGGSQ